MSDSTNGHNAFPKLHNAMWPGLIGKGDDEGQEPPISLETMLEWTAAADVDGQKFEGVECQIWFVRAALRALQVTRLPRVEGDERFRAVIVRATVVPDVVRFATFPGSPTLWSRNELQ